MRQRPGSSRASSRKPVADPAMERQVERLEAVPGLGGLSPDADLGVDVEQDREVRLEPAGRDRSQARSSSTGRPGPVALVGERRVGEARAQDDLTGLERGLDHLRDQLSPRRVEQQRVGARPDPEVRPAQQDLPHSLPEPRPTRLPREHDAPPASLSSAASRRATTVLPEPSGPSTSRTNPSRVGECIERHHRRPSELRYPQPPDARPD